MWDGLNTAISGSEYVLLHLLRLLFTPHKQNGKMFLFQVGMKHCRRPLRGFFPSVNLSNWCVNRKKCHHTRFSTGDTLTGEFVKRARHCEILWDLVWKCLIWTFMSRLNFYLDLHFFFKCIILRGSSPQINHAAFRYS